MYCEQYDKVFSFDHCFRIIQSYSVETLIILRSKDLNVFPVTKLIIIQLIQSKRFDGKSIRFKREWLNQAHTRSVMDVKHTEALGRHVIILNIFLLPIQINNR